jgi:hypothetical protein
MTSEDVARLEAEVADLVSYCVPGVGEPRDLMTVSRLPGYYLPLWLVLILIVLATLFLGVAFGLLLAAWRP